MSISATLSNALTGLAAMSRSAQVVSTNVSNATTEGYSRREIELSARTLGAFGSGVRVDGVVRIVDETLIRERRLASAAVGETSVQAEFYSDFLQFIGEPQDPSSIVARATEFETALLAATSRPEGDARLIAVLGAADALADKINESSQYLQTLREDAERTIAREVDRLNAGLQQIADLNAQILRARGTEQDYPALLDSRQQVIDDIAELIPVRVLPRDNDTVALYTMTGALLIDVEPATFGFTSTAPITPDMTLGSGALSGLTLNGTPIQTAGENAPIGGGRLAGLFLLRDDLAVTAQDDLDAMARDLVTRFEDPGLDPTLNPGDPGLFTDGGSAFDPSNVLGLAGRLAINANTDPSEGGDIWRLRDGLGATTPGNAGDASLIDAMRQRFLEPRAPTGGSFSPASRAFGAFAVDLTSMTGQARQNFDMRLSFETSRQVVLNDAILAEGVDTDQELQKLLLIEQAYAANARVIRTADELIQLLIGL